MKYRKFHCEASVNSELTRSCNLHCPKILGVTLSSAVRPFPVARYFYIAAGRQSDDPGFRM